MTEPLLTDEDMAVRLGKSKWFVQEHCRPESAAEAKAARESGKPARTVWPHTRAGKSIRFTPEQVAAIDALLAVASRPTVAPAGDDWGRRGRTA
jgi:hypothetical protein